MAYNIAANQIQADGFEAFQKGRALRLAENEQRLRMSAIQNAEGRAEEDQAVEMKKNKLTFEINDAKKAYVGAQQILALPKEQRKSTVRKQWPEMVAGIEKMSGEVWDEIDDDEFEAGLKDISARAAGDAGVLPSKDDSVSAETKFKSAHEIELQKLRNEGSLNTVRANSSKAATKTPDLIDNPKTLDLAARVTLSNPERMSDYAARGEAGQARREQVADHQTKLLEEAGMTNADVVQMRARVKAAQKALGKVTEQGAQVAQAEGLARFNGERLLKLFEEVDDTSVPIIEGVMRSGFAKGGGVDEAELKSVLTAFQAETARLLTASPTMMGVVSDASRNEVKEIVRGDMSIAQAKRVINRLFLEFDQRKALNVEAKSEAGRETDVLNSSTQSDVSKSWEDDQYLYRKLPDGTTQRKKK